MKQKVTNKRKAHVHCIAPIWRFMYNAPVAERIKAHFYGADHREFAQRHGFLGVV